MDPKNRKRKIIIDAKDSQIKKLNDELYFYKKRGDYYKNSMEYYFQLNEMNTKYIMSINRAIGKCLPEDIRKNLGCLVNDDFQELCRRTREIKKKYNEQGSSIILESVQQNH